MSDATYSTYDIRVRAIRAVRGEQLPVTVVGKVRDIVLGDHKATAHAIDAFVKTVLSHQRSGDDGADIERELERLAKRIQATVAMLTDPDLADLGELKGTLLELKAKRESLEARRRETSRSTGVVHTEAELRTWAGERFHDLAHVAQGNATFDATRRVIHSYVQRIEIDPHANRGTLILPADALACLESELSTRVPLLEASGGGK